MIRFFLCPCYKLTSDNCDEPCLDVHIRLISKDNRSVLNEYAFEYARKQGRKSIVACHKAGVMKMGDGLFIKTAAEIAKRYPEINY